MPSPRLDLDVGSLGPRLRLARQQAGLTQRDLGRALDPPVTAQAISKYERDLMFPSGRALVGLVRILGVPLDLLTGTRVKSLRGLEFRKRHDTSRRDRALAQVLLIAGAERALEAEDLLGFEPRSSPLTAIAPGRHRSPEALENLAMSVRRDWRLGDEPVPSMSRLLEEHGIRVIEDELPKGLDGLACEVYCGGTRSRLPAVLVSPRTVERKRFTLAHELGHRIIQPSDGLRLASGLSLEKAVDRFAGAFLAPAPLLRRLAGERRDEVPYRELVTLKRQVGISAASLLVRLRQVGIVRSSWAANAFRSFARSWRHSEPEALGRDSAMALQERPRRTEELVWRGLAEQRFHPLRAARLLQCSLVEVEAGLRGAHPLR